MSDQQPNPATTAYAIDVDELFGLHRGDIVRTKGGKCDRVIVELSRANTPDELEYLRQRAEERGHGTLGQRAHVVETRALRNDRPFGPIVRTVITSGDDLMIVELAENVR